MPVSGIVIIITLTCASYVISGPLLVMDDECIEEFTTTTTQSPLQCTTGNVSNVALNKTTQQSSTYFDYNSSKAVDGNTNQWFHEGYTCTHTAEDPLFGDTKPWLIVDLGKPHAVEYIKMYSRNDPCCSERNYDIEARVGDVLEQEIGVKFFRNPLCDRAPGGGYPPGHIFQFNCTTCMVGNFVSVQITKPLNATNETNILSICELEIYGYPLEIRQTIK